MVRSLIALPALLCLSIWAAPPTGADEPVEAPRPEAAEPSYTLSYRFQDTADYHFLLKENAVIVTHHAGQTNETSHNSSLEKHFRVVKTYDDGSALLELVMDRIVMKIDFGNNQVVEFDTDSDAEPPKQLAALRGAVHKPVARARVSPRGELLTLKRTLEDKDDTPPIKPEERQNFLIVLPEGPIRVGETWTHGYDVPIKLSRSANYTVEKTFHLRFNYTLDAVEDGVARISFSSAVTPRIVDPVIRAQFIQQQPTGTIRFDLRSGMILSQSHQVDRTELGVGGPKTSLHVTKQKEETLVQPRTVSANDRR